MRRKKVLLLVVDALTPRVMLSAMDAGRLPNLNRLCRAGFFDPACATVFPSITPAATASIATGRYPSEHGIVGAYWYDAQKHDVAYYGDDLTVIFKEGVGRYFEDFLVRMNRDWLTAPTVYECVERAGLRAACINYLIYRGDRTHIVRVPLPLRLLPGVPASKEVLGPSSLYLGDFVKTPLPGTGKRPRFPGGALRRFGMRDAAAAAILRQLVTSDLPDLTVAYFPDYDFKAHDVGPDEAAPELDELDKLLGKVFTAAGGLEALLRDTCILLTADHAQTHVPEGDEGEVRLHEILHEFAIGEAGRPWSDGEEIKICPNMRAAQIYFRRRDVKGRRRAVRALLSDTRIDHVIEGGADESGDRRYGVSTCDRGSLLFWRGEEGPRHARDEFGQAWSWRGALETLDVSVDAGKLRWGTYPNAFERIAGLLDADSGGALWVTARIGAEFRVAETRAHHAGGSHGSLHGADSLVPLLAAGLPDDIALHAPTRTVDVMPLCLSILGIESSLAVGMPHGGSGAIEPQPV